MESRSILNNNLHNRGNILSTTDLKKTQNITIPDKERTVLFLTIYKTSDCRLIEKYTRICLDIDDRRSTLPDCDKISQALDFMAFTNLYILVEQHKGDPSDKSVESMLSLIDNTRNKLKNKYNLSLAEINSQIFNRTKSYVVCYKQFLKEFDAILQQLKDNRLTCDSAADKMKELNNILKKYSCLFPYNSVPLFADFIENTRKKLNAISCVKNIKMDVY
ncbi:MAG: hypothetical protein PHV30_07775 [Candidatus Margulisbacteria bacterium]|nr:hypothetical protein [Candidatus Margulisiibacteriota bacterium]